MFALLTGGIIGRFAAGAGGVKSLIVSLIMVAGLYAARLLLSYPLARLFGPVRLTLSHGGPLTVLIVAGLGGWYPYFGMWTPKDKTWHISRFKKFQGLSSLVAWLVIISGSALAELIPDLNIANEIR